MYLFHHVTSLNIIYFQKSMNKLLMKNRVHMANAFCPRPYYHKNVLCFMK